MGKNLEALKSRIPQIEAAAEQQGDSKYAHLSGTYKALAEHYAQLCDLKDIELNGDKAPPVLRTKYSQVVITLDGVKLTAEGTYTAEEGPSEDSAGKIADFDVVSVYAGRTELTDLLEDRILEIARLAQLAYEEAAAEAAAAAEFDARRAA